MKKTLSKSDIMGARDLVREPVNVPELEGQIYVARINSLTRAQMDKWMADRKSLTPMQLRHGAILFCACDADGKRLFDDADLALVEGLSYQVIERLFAVADRLNWISLKSYEEATQLFFETKGSTTDSPAPVSSAAP